MEIRVALSSIITGKQAGRYLFLVTLRAHSRETDRRHSGSEKPKEDGRWRAVRWINCCLVSTLVVSTVFSFRSVREDRSAAEWQADKEEEDQHKEVHVEPLL